MVQQFCCLRPSGYSLGYLYYLIWVSQRMNCSPVNVLCQTRVCCCVIGPLIWLDVQGKYGSSSSSLFVQVIEYIFDLQVYAVSCHIQYMTCHVRMGQYEDIRYYIVDVYLRSENYLVSASGHNDCAICFDIGLCFAICVSGIDQPIESGHVYNIDLV